MSTVASPPTGLTVLEKLARSRENLRQAMLAPSALSEDAASQRVDGAAANWLDDLKAIPGASVVMEAVRCWWAQHPFRLTAVVVADAAKAVILPIAQRHPLGLVAGAFLVGGLLAWSRPWRWILTPALFAGLLPQIVAKAAAHMPPQSWISILMSLAQLQKEQGKPR